MPKYLLLLSFLLSFSAHSLTVEGVDFPASRTVILDKSVVSATLGESISLKLGQNELKNIPEGTRFSFFLNKGPEEDLKVAGIIISKKIENQVWTLPNQKQISVNCGRFGGSVAFMYFGRNHELLEGCKSTQKQKVDTPIGPVTLNEKSSLAFFKNGNLRGSTKTSGRLLIEDNTILIEPESSLRFHDNQRLHFFTPEANEYFFFKTELSDKTSFYQPKSDQPLAIVFHDNGFLSTAILSAVVKYNLSMSAFGTPINIRAGEGPIGFSTKGSVDRLVLDRSTELTVTTDTFVRSTEMSTGVISLGHFKPGMKISLSRGTQLFLNEQRELRAYPEQGAGGLIFFNELSKAPF